MMDLTIAVPVLVALVQVVKIATGMESRFAPLLSVVLGCVGFYFLSVGEVGPRLFEGLIAGLSASGLYSGVRAQIR